MPIIVNIDVMLARRKMSSGELAEKIGLSATNLSILKTGKAKAIRLNIRYASNSTQIIRAWLLWSRYVGNGLSLPAFPL